LEVVILTYPSLTKHRFLICSPITIQLASNNAPEKKKKTKPTSKNVHTSNQYRKILNLNKDTCKGISNTGRYKNIIICVAALGLLVLFIFFLGGGGEAERLSGVFKHIFYLCSFCIICQKLCARKAPRFIFVKPRGIFTEHQQD
jgi:hypothetical protein